MIGRCNSDVTIVDISKRSLRKTTKTTVSNHFPHTFFPYFFVSILRFEIIYIHAKSKYCNFFLHFFRLYNIIVHCTVTSTADRDSQLTDVTINLSKIVLRLPKCLHKRHKSSNTRTAISTLQSHKKSDICSLN